MLTPAPSAGYLVAVSTYFDGATYSAGYVIAGKSIPETTVNAVQSKQPASPETTAKPEPAVVKAESGTESSITDTAERASDATETTSTSTTMVEPTKGDVLAASVDDATGGDTNGANVLTEVKPTNTNEIPTDVLTVLFGVLLGLLGSRIARSWRR